MASRDRIKGITIEIAGDTSKLTKSIEETKKSLIDTQRELNSVNKLLKFDPSNTSLLAQKTELLKKAITDTEQRLKSLKELQIQFGDTSKLTEEQKEKYRYLEREIAQCENQLKNYKSEQESVNEGRPFKQVSDDVEDLGRKSLKTSDIIKANLISQAIISGVKALASAFKKLSSTLNDWSEKAKTLEEQEAKVARVMKNTTKASQSQIDALIKMTAEQEKLGVVSQEAQLAGLQELGTYVSKKKSLEKLLPVMNDMIAQQYGIGASMESAAGIATMLGKVLGNGQVDALSRLGYKFDDAQKKVLKYGSEEKKVAMLSKIINQSVGGMNKALGETDAGKLEIANSYLEDMKKNAGKVFTTLKGRIASEFLPSIKKISNAFSQIMDGTLTVEKGMDVMIDVVMDAVNTIAKKLPDFIETIVKTIADNLPEILDAVLKTITMVGKELGKKLPTLIPILVKGLLDLVDTILDNIDEFVDAAIEIVIGVAEGLIEAMPILIEKIPMIIEKLVKAIINNAPKLLEAGVELIIKLGEGLITGIPEAIAKIPQVINDLVKAFIDKMGSFIEVGKDIIKGIVKGIEIEWEYTKQDAKFNGVIPAIVNFFKRKLGIASPSKVMRDEIGQNIGLGIVEGINDTITDVQNAMLNLSSGIEASVNPTINPTANTNPLYIQIDKFYNNRQTDVQQLAEELEYYRRNSALAKGGV